MEKALTLKQGTRVRAVLSFASYDITKDRTYELQEDAKAHYDDDLRPSRPDLTICNCFFPVLNDEEKLQDVFYGVFELAED